MHIHGMIPAEYEEDRHGILLTMHLAVYNIVNTAALSQPFKDRLVTSPLGNWLA